MDTTMARRVSATTAVILPPAVLLVWWPASLAPFAPFKAAVLGVLVAVCCVAAAVVMRAGAPGRVSTSLVWGWIALAGVLAASTVGSVDPWRSFRGTYPRYESLPVVLTAASLVWLLGIALDRRALARATELLFAATTVCGLYALAQAAGQDPLHVVRAGRAWGTVGNPVLLGSVMALLAPYPLAVTLTGKGTSWMRRLAPLGCAVAVSACFASQTRGAWLGLIVGTVVTVALCRHHVVRDRALVVGAVIAVAIFLVAVVPQSRDMVLGRVQAVAAPGSSASARLLKYEVGLGMLKDRPLLGWGWDTVPEVYPSRVPKDWMRRDPEGRITDRLHAEWLDVAVATGLFGLLALLTLLGLAIRTGVKALRAGATPTALAAGQLGALTAYAVASATAFPALSTWPLAWATAGLLVATGIQATARESGEPREAAARVDPTLAAVVALAVMGAVSAAFAVQDISSDQLLFKATMTPGRTQALAYGVAAAAFPNDAYVQLRASAGLLTLGRTVNEPDALAQAERLARRASALRPLDPAYTANLADTLLAQALRGIKPVLPEASRTYAKALARAPRDPEILESAGIAEFAIQTTASIQRAADLWSRSFAVNPDSPDTALDLALAYERMGRKGAAREWIDIAANLAPGRDDIVQVQRRLGGH